jgi:hypothetical protein
MMNGSGARTGKFKFPAFSSASRFRSSCTSLKKRSDWSERSARTPPKSRNSAQRTESASHFLMTRSADRKAATIFRGIVARCHASHFRISSALCRSYIVNLKRFLKVWDHGAPMGQSSRRQPHGASRLIGIINSKSLTG